MPFALSIGSSKKVTSRIKESFSSSMKQLAGNLAQALPSKQRIRDIRATKGALKGQITRKIARVPDSQDQLSCLSLISLSLR